MPGPSKQGVALHGPSDSILLALKTEGAQTAAALAESLKVSRQAIRQQLERLRAEGLVAYVAEKGRVGRPGYVWGLSSAGHATFPDGHAEALVGLIAAVKTQFGEAALDTLIDRRQAGVVTAYREAMSEVSGLSAVVARLAELRTAEGYMATLIHEPDGSVILIENHCPICAAATHCQGFCRAELEMFRNLLGDYAEVVRVEHLLSNARRCAYKIRPIRSA
ncbi:MAG: transcriptional regulator [Proteobacteria bacterium]|nr:transcriptional regulator [Pseudomonadota bacterium]